MSAGNGQLGHRLDTMLARDVTLQWAEAVAIVQAACRQFATPGASGFPVPSQIVLSRDGAVVALATTQQLPVTAAAHLLGSMLADDAPVRLRLLVSQATGADGAYGSLPEFCEALAYFERPDPVSLLRELFRRVEAAPERATGTVEPSAPPVASIETPAPRNAVPATAGKHTRRPIVTAALILACLAVALIGNRFLGMTLPGDAPVESAGEPSAAPPPAAAKGSKERARVQARTSRRVAHGVSVPASGPGSAPPVSGLADSSRLEPGAELALWMPPIEPWRTVDALQPVAHVYRDVVADTAGFVYDKGDPDVFPPQSVYPRLPTDPPGTDARNRTVLELLIAADGSVERVRLRTPPRDVHEFMLVSAAKAWRFDPATVHGRPVRFLYDVAISHPD
jgi:hypothetical protein